ncbi:IS66 family transposase [Acinetobacter sp.]|uniref:IS66 family transposase n=1 Tax=Acinetobacter sp. TaxID=472 RepID=UPI003CFBE162
MLLGAGHQYKLRRHSEYYDRASKAIHPHYEAIGEKAQAARVNHVDETPWKNNGKLNWLWVMASSVVAYFMVHTNRSKDAFKSLVGGWEGILVSDGYRLYRNWVHARQTCLAHLIRRAKGLAERKEPELVQCGTWARDEFTSPMQNGQGSANKSRVECILCPAQPADCTVYRLRQ